MQPKIVWVDGVTYYMVGVDGEYVELHQDYKCIVSGRCIDECVHKLWEERRVANGV